MSIDFDQLERAEPTNHSHRYHHANALVSLGVQYWDKGDHPTGTARQAERRVAS
ncbi:hypothetical protein BC739_007852 [Kutzneria viridogrisea]|uniref:Uncharacterized protein n=1 Tax=Kutzneria viridogrisea TaxID=47990 RepID=A0ABR6BUP0_9PSEU|nr:hypothetical protein [Kutzneria viridogrisea]